MIAVLGGQCPPYIEFHELKVWRQAAVSLANQL
jgi:hypothetical protein